MSIQRELEEKKRRELAQKRLKQLKLFAGKNELLQAYDQQFE